MYLSTYRFQILLKVGSFLPRVNRRKESSKEKKKMCLESRFPLPDQEICYAAERGVVGIGKGAVRSITQTLSQL